MSPIVGAGFALGTYNFILLKKSLKNLLVATLVSLFVSTVYFFISPFKDVQSELLARTTPTIYDVLIAFFGGLVGVIATTRVEKGNPIPGVAIATALMPPLCTAGYGLAIGNLAFFLGAFYLYSINCVFICIATFVIVKYLDYPIKVQVDRKQQRRIRNLVTFLIVFMLLPSSYLAYSLYCEQQFKKHSDHFIEKEFSEKGYTLVYKKIKYREFPHKIELAFLSKRFEDMEIQQLTDKLFAYKINNTKLVFRQDSSDKLMNLKGDILNEINTNSLVINEKEARIKQLEAQIKTTNDNTDKLTKEAKALFSNLQSLSVANHTFKNSADSLLTITVVLYESSTPLSISESTKLKNWLKQRLETPNIDIYRREKIKKSIGNPLHSL
jgi:uncharacterized hydrophobic protein (TIGR00271 family)